MANNCVYFAKHFIKWIINSLCVGYRGKKHTGEKMRIKAMLGMLGGGENMSENLSDCLFTLGI